MALQQGHDKVVAVLLENDTRGKVKLPALHIAAKKDDVKAATLLLASDHGVDSTSKVWHITGESLLYCGYRYIFYAWCNIIVWNGTKMW